MKRKFVGKALVLLVVLCQTLAYQTKPWNTAAQSGNTAVIAEEGVANEPEYSIVMPLDIGIYEDELE